MKKLGPLLLIFLITYGAAKAAVAIFGEGATAAYVGGIVITIAFLYIESISSPKSTTESGAASKTKIIPQAPPVSDLAHTTGVKLKLVEATKTALDKPLSPASPVASQAYIKPTTAFEREIAYPPVLTFRERMDRERKHAHIKAALVKAAGMFVLLMLGIALSYTLYSIFYSIFR